MWLGQRERTERLAAQHGRQPASLLLVAAPGHDGVLRQDMHGERHGHRHIGRAQLRREWRGGQPKLAHLGKERAVVALGLVPLDRTRCDLALRELTGRLLEQSLLVTERRRRGRVETHDWFLG